MFTVDVKTDVTDVIKKFYSLEPRQFPFVVAVALTKTGQQIKQAVKEELPKVFDKPTAFTLNSVMLKPATKEDLSAKVWFKDFAGKGTPASKYLLPQIEGGPRKTKRFERALQAVGILPSGMYCVPSSSLKLDQYGNIPNALIIKILSELKAFGQVGYLANRTARSAKRKRGHILNFYFVRPGDNTSQPPGIYQRNGKWSEMVIAFVKQPHYQKRLKFFEIAEQERKKNFQRELEASINAVLKSSSRRTFIQVGRLVTG